MMESPGMGTESGILNSDVSDGSTLDTRSILETSLAYEWYLDLDKRKFDFDKDVIEQLLAAKGQVSSLDDILDYMPPHQRDEVKNALVRVLRSGDSESITCTLMPKSDGFIQLEISMEKPKKNAVCGTFRPLIGLSNIKDICEVFQALFENKYQGIIITDAETRILSCNRYFEQLKGFSLNEVLGLKTNIFNSGKHSGDFFKAMWASISEHGYWNGNILSQNAAGEDAPQELTIQKISLSDGRIYYLGLFIDLSKQLERVADKGSGGVELLTQLPTREKFIELLEESCASNLVENHKIVMALQPGFDSKVLLDYRHSFSDILSRSRTSHISGYLSNGIFVVCIESHNQNDISDQRAIMNAIRDFFQEIKVEVEKEIYKGVVHGRIGVSIIGYDTNTPKRAVTHAMQAMMESQQSQEQMNICFFHSKTHQALERRKLLEVIVRGAIENQELMVHYQPIINVTSWEISKFEALCRFTPVGAIDFTTQEMILIAEDLDLIPELDSAVGIIALGNLNKIREICGEHVGLTINRSLNTKIGTDKTLKATAEMLSQHAEDLNGVTIELTESAYFESSPTQGFAIQNLRDMGVKIAIDDFGTGYSSFSYLRDRHFDILKIDRDFVQNIKEGSDKYHIVKMISDLSHTLGIQVVAEGVETIEELNILKSIGIDYMQGFLFSKPLPIENIASADDYKIRMSKELESFHSVQKAQSLMALASLDLTPFSPDIPLSRVNDTITEKPQFTYPVLVHKKCVGIVSRSEVNLHMTPQMGTDLESNKEAAIWKRPVNQLMSTEFEKLDFNYPLEEIDRLFEEKVPFPWVLTDEEGHYKGIVEAATVMDYWIQL
ncbi:EAL domain-containing protein [Vibrio sp. ZSDE26]|uniref:EAL domain-containing protein n=1 Tax=Vibrio amylolyticus TaxID=2847292 RepID=A0A9X1XHH1_9VIBR|nr:EAL domain-containing protein [Vibrio amylolyticus]MCK6261873.1 EAL domain-containing protein [Vibrio amylolyticus]